MTVTLLTGADGHIGSLLAQQLLTATDRHVLLAVRAVDAAALRKKHRRLGALARHPRSRVIALNLDDRELLPDTDLWDVTEIVHCAAATDFGIARSLAENVNVAGTARVVALARRCGNLRRFALLSSLYAAGLRPGPCTETCWTDRAAFANHYEWSKWQAEQLVTAEPGLPWQIFRVATVIADDSDGTVSRHNVIHNTLRLLFYGLLPVLPAQPGTRIYTVTGDFVARSLTSLLLAGDDRRCFHLSQDGTDAATIDEVLAAAFSAFARDPQFAGAGILPPRYCNQAAFELLASSARRFGTPLADALASVEPFVAQLYADKTFCTDDTRTALDGDRPPPGAGIVSATAMQLAATRWGLRAPNDEAIRHA